MFEREIASGVPAEWRQPVQVKHQLYVQFLADEALVAKFEQVRALLCGRYSDMSFAEVLDILATEFLYRRSPAARKERRDARKKDQKVHTPTSGSNHASPSRHIPAAVRDEVYTRDGGQCMYTAHDGTRCHSRKGLEIDHIAPVAAGGSNDPSNLRLLCPAHNLRPAERTLGARVMAAFWQQE